MKDDRLAQLGALAALRTDRASARLVRLQGAIDGIESKAAALRDVRPEPPGSVSDAVMRDRWHRWRTEQLRFLGQQAARLHAAAQPLREAQARDRARQRIIERLADRSRR